MEQAHALEPVILLLLVGILAITLVRPLRLSPIVGYLLAGLIIGPHALGLVPDSETTHLLAELGVVFLLFDIGLHFSLQSIWDARRDILGLGPLQIVLCGAGLRRDRCGPGLRRPLRHHPRRHARAVLDRSRGPDPGRARGSRTARSG